jgi:tetratricopeptide (TPR) repeat protein
LYELLTGTTPFDGGRLRAANFDELRRILREEEPPRPSARLSTLAAVQATTLAEQHRTDVRRLVQTIEGELDWIVMKCLEKDRNRRYETANGLANDIERYLCDEPVTACPPSAGYRFRKFARRNKIVLIGASAALCALIAAVAGLAISNRLIAEQRERAEAQTKLAEMRALEEQRASAQARAEAAKSNAVVTLLQDMLAAAHPDSAGGKDVTIRALLDRFSTGLEDRLADQPGVEAALREVIGSVYTRLRLMDEAEPHLRRALELHRRVFGEEHMKFADSQRHLGWNVLEKNRANPDAEKYARNALAIYQKQDDPGKALEAMWLLVLSLDGQSKLAEAETQASAALLFARQHDMKEHTVVPNLLHQLAWIQVRRGDYQRAERLARESVERHLRVHGEMHPETAFGLTYLAASLSWQGKFAEAEEHLKKAISIFRSSLPSNHSFLRPTVQDLVSVLLMQGKYDDAIQLIRDGIRSEPGYAEAHNYLAWMLATCPDEKLRNPEEAVRLAAKAVELAPQEGSYLNTLGIAQYRAGEYSAARETLQKSIDIRDDGDCNDWFFIAMTEWQLGNHDTAREWYGKAAARMKEHGSRDGQLISFREEARKLIQPPEAAGREAE